MDSRTEIGLLLVIEPVSYAWKDSNKFAMDIKHPFCSLWVDKRPPIGILETGEMQRLFSHQWTSNRSYMDRASQKGCSVNGRSSIDLRKYEFYERAEDIKKVFYWWKGFNCFAMKKRGLGFSNCRYRWYETINPSKIDRKYPIGYSDRKPSLLIHMFECG